MIYVCRITDISQATCILRSIHAHFLQLLRDGALRGRTCRRRGPTLNIFLAPLLWFAGSPSLQSLTADPSSQRRPYAASRFGVQATFPVFSSASVVCLSLLSTQDISAVQSAREACPLSCSPPLERLDVLWRTAPSSAADLATSLSTQSAPRAHRPTPAQQIHDAV